MTAAFDFCLPTNILYGAGRLDECGEAVKALGNKAIIVCDPFAVEAGLASRLATVLAAEGVASVVYDQVIPNPTNTLIDAGAELAVAEECDVAIGLGGGSSMDAAKGIAVAATHPGPIWPYAMGDIDITDATLPIVAVTTTSGTGSQCTCFAVISNHETPQKPGMGSPYVIPALAVVDPELMLTAPPALTANTGFDVFTHAVEALTSNAASPMSDLFAQEAIRLVAKNLPTCYRDGANLEARAALALADTYSGIAICHAVVTLAHVMAHVISGKYSDISHGDALFTIYREILRFNATVLPEKHAFVAQQLVPGTDDVVAAFEQFFAAFQFENKLKAKDLDDAAIAAIAEDTFTYMKAITELNPREADVADAKAILLRSLR